VKMIRESPKVKLGCKDKDTPAVFFVAFPDGEAPVLVNKNNRPFASLRAARGHAGALGTATPVEEKRFRELCKKHNISCVI